ncbi:MAG TPA: hypothetical protein VIL06_04715 [Coriobacteriia bacterium]
MRVLEARVRAAVGEVATFVVCAADDLPLAEYGALMARVYSSGDDFPAVLVDGDLACVSGIDPDAVIAALGGR